MLRRLVDGHCDRPCTRPHHMSELLEFLDEVDIDELVIEGEHIDLRGEGPQRVAIAMIAHHGSRHHPHRRVLWVCAEDPHLQREAQGGLEHHEGELPRSDDPDGLLCHDPSLDVI